MQSLRINIREKRRMQYRIIYQIVRLPSLPVTFFLILEQDEGRCSRYYEILRTASGPRNPLGADTAPCAANAFPSASWECFWRYVSVLTPATIPPRPRIRARPDVLRMRVWVFTRTVRFLNPPVTVNVASTTRGKFLPEIPIQAFPFATWILENSPRSWTTSFREKSNYIATRKLK